VKFTICLPVIKTGKAPNVIPSECEMDGLLRSFDDDITIELKGRIDKLVNEVCLARKCKVDCNIKSQYPATKNTEKEAENVIRVGKKVLGESNVLTDESIIVKASEDFSFYTRIKPGAFFFLSAARNKGDMLHTKSYNPDDKVIEIASNVWYRLVEDRFSLNFG